MAKRPINPFETDSRSVREYGYGSSQEFVKSIPRVVSKADGVPACPNCGCETLYDIELEVQHPMLAGDGKGKGRYIGCPACPFASPMIMAATSASGDSQPPATPAVPTPHK